MFRDDLDAVGLVATRCWPLRQLAEERTLTGGRPGVVEWSFHLDPLDGQSGALVFVGSDLMNDLGPCQAIGEDGNCRVRLEGDDEFDNGRLVGRSVEVADQALSTCQLSSGDPHAIGDGLAGTL